MSKRTFTALAVALVVATTTTFVAASAASPAAAAPDRSVFVPVAPCALPVVKAKKKRPVVVSVAGRCGVPQDAVAVTLAIQAKGSRPGALRVWAAGGNRPRTPVLTWSSARKPVATQALSRLGGGRVSLAGTKGKTRVEVDVVGYYRRIPTRHTVSINPWTMALIDSTTAIHGTSNGCVANASTAAATGRLPLSLPVGSRIRSVRVEVFDGPATEPYALQLVRFRTTPTGLTVDSRTPLGSGGSGSVVVQTHTTSVDQVVDDQHSFAISMSNLKNFNNGLCSVTVTYDDPS